MPREFRKLLQDLVADDPGRRERAASALSRYDHKQLVPAVAAAVAAPDFPGRAFYRRGAELVVTAQKVWLAAFALSEDDGETPATKGRRATADPHRRAAVDWSMAIDAAVHGGSPPPDVTGLSCGGIALRGVLPGAIDAALAAPEAVWLLLETRGCEQVAAETLERAGERAAGLFLPELLRFFDVWGFAQVNYYGMLAAVGRGDPGVIRIAIARLSAADDDGDETWAWAQVLSAMGPAAGTPDVVALLHGFARSRRRLRRATAAATLPRVAPADPRSAEVVLRLLDDSDRNEEDSVRPAAVSGAAYLSAFADRLVPRLAELLGEYDEPNPDHTYGGRAARVCGTLLALPGGPPAAVPAVRAVLREVAAERNLFLATSLVRVLEAAGDAAATALPELRALHGLRGRQSGEAGEVRRDIGRLIRKLTGRSGGD